MKTLVDVLRTRARTCTDQLQLAVTNIELGRYPEAILILLKTGAEVRHMATLLNNLQVLEHFDQGISNASRSEVAAINAAVQTTLKKFNV